MPPRKSDASKMATDIEGISTPAKDSLTADKTPKDKEKEKEKDGINIEDLNLPKSVVTRLAKGVLPPNTQIQGNATLALSKSATVFVNYLATHANDYAQGANRKTIAPADVLRALEDLEFDFKPRLEAELAKFNEVQAVKRNTYRKKVAADKVKDSSPGESGEHSGGVDGEVGGGGEPAAKKARVEGGGADTRDHSEVMMDDDTMGDMGDDNDIGDDGEEGEGDGAEEDFAEDDGDEDDGEGGEGEEGEPPEEGHEGRELEDEALDNGEDSD